MELANDKAKLEFVQDMQEGPGKLNGLTIVDADDLYCVVVREHTKGSYRDKDNVNGSSMYGDLQYAMFNTTLVNVAKIAQFAAREKFLFRMWAETLVYRGARERNKCMGKGAWRHGNASEQAFR